MSSKIMLVGEPMGLFIAQTEGPLETVKTFSTAVAGAEFNVAVGLSRLGHIPGYLTKLGKDPFGKQIVNTMMQNRIDTSLISFSEDRATGFMLKSKVRAGDPEIYYYRKNSAASSICKEDIDRIDFSEYKYLHMTGIFPALSQATLEAAKYLQQKAKANGLTIFFDPNLRPQLWGDKEKMAATINELAFGADYFMPGIKEGMVLTGCSTPESVADFYLQRGVGTVIVKVGRKGAYFAAKQEQAYVAAFQEKRLVDTVGAGDGFAAGVISAVMEGLPIAEAVSRGNAIGAIQVASFSDNEGLPTREELDEFMRTAGRIENET
jgi:2-dehydro-3-deoxygluconokinase